jgi:hypothetical protein
MRNQIRKWNRSDLAKVLGNENGRIGYLIAWLLGVPASVLLVIFLIFGGH